MWWERQIGPTVDCPELPKSSDRQNSKSAHNHGNFGNSRDCDSLIDPSARATLLVFLCLFLVGRTEIAILVEVLLGVLLVLAHVNLEFLFGALTLPPVIPVAT